MPAHGSCSARTLVIGIDGATFDQIIPLVKEGRLSHIGALLEQGSWGPLRSTIPPVTAPAWSSFMTGVNPGRHGIYDFRYRDTGTYELRTNNLTMNRAPTLWEVLSRHDKRSCLINIPASWPPRPINGFWVTGILTPADATTYTYPPELTEQIRRAIPDYEVWPASVFHPTGREREFLRTIEELTWKRVELFRFLQTRAEWDTAMVVFMGADQVQHAMWHYQDPTHPQYDPDAPAEFRDAIAHTYEVIDAAVGALLAEAGRELNVFLVSDHGFGPLDDWFHINTWLIQEGLMVVKPHVKSRLKHLLFSLGFTPLNLYEWLLRLRLNRAVAHATRHRREETFALLRRLFVSFDDVDWSRTVAYSIGNAGPIFINLAGREPQGCVPPERYEETLEMVAERLRRITDPRTGRPLVTEIVFGKDVYAGPYASNGPDIMVLMRDMRVCAYGNTQLLLAPLADAGVRPHGLAPHGRHPGGRRPGHPAGGASRRRPPLGCISHHPGADGCAHSRRPGWSAPALPPARCSAGTHPLRFPGSGAVLSKRGAVGILRRGGGDDGAPPEGAGLCVMPSRGGGCRACRSSDSCWPLRFVGGCPASSW
jgi:predicted AlkP superfamily phosphohydrolase/phosphomutase